jgi:hypothetical protein
LKYLLFVIGTYNIIGETTVIGIVHEQVGCWTISAVAFSQEQRRITLPVHAGIGNSVPTSSNGRAVLLNWKRAVAAAAKQARSGAPLDPHQVYSISAGFSFHMPSHGNQGLEVENYLKPTFDALAAGLFCDPAADCQQFDRFAFDDTGFKYLFVYRLPDARLDSEEGVGFVVSVRGACAADLRSQLSL